MAPTIASSSGRFTRFGSFFRTSLVAPIALMATMAVTSPAFAQDKITADRLFDDGRKALEAGDFKKACESFAASQKADPSVGALINLGTCNEKLGNLATAWSNYKQASSLARQRSDNDRATSAAASAAALEPKLSTLTITAKTATPGLTVTRDGADIGGAGALGVAIPIDGGEHAIEATAKGYKPWNGKITVGAQGDKKSLDIPALEALPPDQQGGDGSNPADTGSSGNGLLIGGAVVGGIGVVGLIVGAATGGVASSGKSDVDKLCPNKTCNTQAGKDKLDSTKTMATVSTVGFIAGGVLAAAGGTMIIVSVVTKKKKPVDEKPTAVHFVPSFGPQGGGGMLFGRF